MTNFRVTKIVSLIALAGAMSFASMPAQAQSTEEVLGALIGGTAGSVIGGKIDNKGSNAEGQVIGAIAGGTLGYIIGDALDNDKDKQLHTRYDGRSGDYYVYNGRAYRRYQDPQYGYVAIPIRDNDRYYYADGRKKTVSNYNARKQTNTVRRKDSRRRFYK